MTGRRFLVAYDGCDEAYWALMRVAPTPEGILSPMDFPERGCLGQWSRGHGGADHERWSDVDL